MDEPAVAELVALAHERGVPVLIHAGRGIPALGRADGAARRAQPGRAADPRPRRDLRPGLAVARAARPPQRPDRHGVVEPGRPRRAVRARAAGEHRVGERLAVRPPDVQRGDGAALRAAGRAWARTRCAGSRAGRSRACSTGARRPTSGRRRARRRAALDLLLERAVSHLTQRVRARRRRGRPDGAARAGAARLRGRRPTGRTPPVFAAVLEELDALRARAGAAAAGPALPGRAAPHRARARSWRARPTCRCRRCPARRRRRGPRPGPDGLSPRRRPAGSGSSAGAPASAASATRRGRSAQVR